MHRQRLLLFFLSHFLINIGWMDANTVRNKTFIWCMFKVRKKEEEYFAGVGFRLKKPFFCLVFQYLLEAWNFNIFSTNCLPLKKLILKNKSPADDAFGCVGDLSSVNIQFSQIKIPGSIPSPNWVFPFSVSFIANCFSALWLIVVYLAGLNVKFYDWTKLSHSLLHVRFCFYNFFVHLLQNVGTVKFYDSCPRFFYCLFVFWIESEC